MRYLYGAALAVSLIAAGGPVWAADESASTFYALSDLRPGNVTRLRPLSDARLGAIEGSARLPSWTKYSGIPQVRKLVFEVLLYRVLSDLFRGASFTSSPVQNNIIIQVNFAVGNNISQTNGGFQYNISTAMQRLQ